MSAQLEIKNSDNLHTNLFSLTDKKEEITDIFEEKGLATNDALFKILDGNIEIGERAIKITGLNLKELRENTNWGKYWTKLKGANFDAKSASYISMYLAKAELEKKRKEEIIDDIFLKKFRRKIKPDTWEIINRGQDDETKGKNVHHLYKEKETSIQNTFKLKTVIERKFKEEGVKIPEGFWEISLKIKEPEKQFSFINSELKRLKKEKIFKIEKIFEKEEIEIPEGFFENLSKIKTDEDQIKFINSEISELKNLKKFFNKPSKKGFFKNGINKIKSWFSKTF